MKIKNWNKHVEKTNAKFDAATPAQKRVMIARDVINRIESKYIIADSGSFGRNIEGYGQAKEFINTKTCSVCAKGALFCSIVGRVNKFKLEEFDSNAETNGDIESKIHAPIREYFSDEQIALIETAFEGEQYLESINIDTWEAVDFYEELRYSDHDRLIAICQNIIKNKGTFKP